MFDDAPFFGYESAALLAEPVPLVIAEALVPEEEELPFDESVWAPDVPPVSNPFALLIEPELALAAAERIGKLKLPCRVGTLEGLKSKNKDPELARFDAAVESGYILA